MKALLAVILFLLVEFVPTNAKVSSANVGNETSSSSSFWLFNYLQPSRQELQEDLEAKWKLLEQQVVFQKTKFEEHLTSIERDVQATIKDVERDLQSTETRIKRRIEKDILKQRQGWQRLRNSIRDHLGLLLGGHMTLVGGSLTPPTSSGLQAAHLTWFSLQKTNITKGIHDPWLKDAVSGAVAISIIPKLSSPDTQTVISLLTIAVALGRSVGIISDHLLVVDHDVVKHAAITKTALQVIVSGLGTALLYHYTTPPSLSLVATSLAGATIVFQSVICEVAGNWFYMIQRLGQEQQQSLRQFVYKKLQKKLLYPVSSAFEQIRASLYNETLASPSLQEQVKNAINSSYQVRLVWSCATVGILFQVLVLHTSKPMQAFLRKWKSAILAGRGGNRIQTPKGRRRKI